MPGLRLDQWQRAAVGETVAEQPRVVLVPAKRRPEDPLIAEVRQDHVHGSDAFGSYVAQIWNDLREEASRGMKDDEARRAGAPR